MAVEREATPHFVDDGQPWFFCSTACRDEFSANPGRFPAGATVA
jgi:YHS domain-containing protein